MILLFVLGIVSVVFFPGGHIQQPGIDELLANPQIEPDGVLVNPPHMTPLINDRVCVSVDYGDLVRQENNWNQEIRLLVNNAQLIVDDMIYQISNYDAPYPTLGLFIGPPIIMCYELSLEEGSHVATFFLRGTTRETMQYSWVFYVEGEDSLDEVP